MAIELYLCPPGSKDFKLNLFKNAISGISGDYSRVYYIAPSRHMTDAFKNTFHNMLASAGKSGCYIPPKMSTLKELSRSLSAYGGKKLLPKHLVPAVISDLADCGMGHANILAGFVSEIKNHYPDSSPEHIGAAIKNAFYKLGIHEDVVSRAEEAIKIFAQYGDALSSAGFIDPDDALTCDFVKRLDIDILLLDGFYEITITEESFLKKLVAQAKRSILTVPISDADDDLRFCYSHFITREFGIAPVSIPARRPDFDKAYFPASSMEEELEDIARHIKSNFVSGKLRDLDNAYVIFPDPSPYKDMAERVFKRYGIPLRMHGRPDRSYADILSLLESASDGYPRLPFARFLMSPFFGDKNIEHIRPLVPKTCLSGLIKGKEHWLNALSKAGPAFRKSGEKIFKKLSPLESFKEEISFGDFAERVDETLSALEFKPADDNSDISSLLGQLGQIGEITGRETGLKNLIEALRRIFDASSVGLGGDGVRVTGLFESRGIDPGHLYLAGIKDGDIPARPEIDYLLPDKVRDALGLIDMGRYLHLQERIFRRLTASANKLRVSHPTMEGDRVFLPSLFLSGWEAKNERVFGLFSEEENMTRKGKTPFTARIEEIEDIRKKADDSSIRATDIDYYRQCPRRFFIEKAIGLEPPELKDYEVEAKTIGTLAHRIMEKAIQAYDPDVETFKENIGGLIDEALSGEQMDDFFKSLLKGSFLKIVPEIHAMEEGLRKSGYVFEASEVAVEGEPIAGIKIRGKIDRIDRNPDGGVAVIDYKTGGAELSGSSVIKRGESLQLFIYAMLLKTLGMEAERVGIYSLKDFRIKWVPGAREKKPFSDFIGAALGYLEETVTRLRNGEFPAAPINEQSCRRCHERPYCPYIQK